MSRGGRRLTAAVAAAMVLAALREFPATSGTTLLLVKSLLHPTSLADNPLVRALRESPYAWAINALAHGTAWLCAALGAAPEIPINALLLILWAAHAAVLYRFVSEVSGREEAGVLAVLFAGAGMPFVMADAPYHLEGAMRRALCLPPFLWGLLALLRGRRWQALSAVAVSTYLHATPGIYAWPFLFLEDGLEAWRRPGGRRGFCLRAAAAAAAAAPLLWAVMAPGRAALDPEFARMNFEVIWAWYIGGVNAVGADWVFLLEGTALIAVALWQIRRLDGAGLLGRMLALCAALLVFGAISYRAAAAHLPGMGLWNLGPRIQPFLSLSLVEMAGQAALAAWLARLALGRESLVFAILVFMATSAAHDFVSRLACLGVCLCLSAGLRRAALAIAGGACALPFCYWAAPELFQRAVVAIGLRGGLFSLPAFHPALGAALAAALGLGSWASRWSPESAARAVLAWGAAVFLAACGLGRARDVGALHGFGGMAAWIERHTPARSVIAISPLGLLGPACDPFMSAAQRSVFSCARDAGGALFGPSSAGLVENLKAVGMDFSRVRKRGDYDLEEARLDAALTPELAARLSARHGVTHLLLRSGRPWPGEPEHEEDGLALYRLRSAAARTPRP